MTEAGLADDAGLSPPPGLDVEFPHFCGSLLPKAREDFKFVGMRRALLRRQGSSRGPMRHIMNYFKGFPGFFC